MVEAREVAAAALAASTQEEVDTAFNNLLEAIGNLELRGEPLNLTWLWIILGILAGMAITVSALLLILKKKRVVFMVGEKEMQVKLVASFQTIDIGNELNFYKWFKDKKLTKEVTKFRSGLIKKTYYGERKQKQ